MSYEAEWSEYRNRRRIFWWISLTYVPAVFTLGSIFRAFVRTDAVIGIVAVGWMIAFVVAGSRMTYWPCPRCGDAFFNTWWYHNPFASRCVHCGLRKWANEDSGPAEARKRIN